MNKEQIKKELQKINNKWFAIMDSIDGEVNEIEKSQLEALKKREIELNKMIEA
jgi:hypothetical protein